MRWCVVAGVDYKWTGSVMLIPVLITCYVGTGPVMLCAVILIPMVSLQKLELTHKRQLAELVERNELNLKELELSQVK